MNMKGRQKKIFPKLLIFILLGYFIYPNANWYANACCGDEAPSFEKSICNQAHSLLGKPYKEGGTTPSGFDTSGFVQYVFKHSLAKIALPRTVTEQYKKGEPVKITGPLTAEHALPADLVFFKTDRKLQSVGIMISDEEFITVSTRKGVVIQTLKNSYWKKNFYGAKRLILPSSSIRKQLNEIYSSAKEGKISGVEFGLGSKKEDIIKKWGQPDSFQDNSIGYLQNDEKGASIVTSFEFNSKSETTNIYYGDFKTKFTAYDLFKVLGMNGNIDEDFMMLSLKIGQTKLTISLIWAEDPKTGPGTFVRFHLKQDND